MATSTEVLAEPRELALERQAPTLQQQAQALKITSPADLERAVELTQAVKEMRAEAERTVRPAIDAAHKSHKAALAVLARIDDPLKVAELTLKTKIGEYSRGQEAAAAREAERLRIEAQQRRDEQVEVEVEAAEAQGATVVEVAAIIEQAERTPMIVPAVYVAPKPAGLSTPKTYKAEVTNMLEFVRWLALNPAWLGFIEVKQGALDQQAKRTPQMKIPGVQVKEFVNVRIGARK